MKVPLLLKVPPKLLLIVGLLNLFRYFLIEGGRGSGKSVFVGRLILYICSKRKVRVICAREIQNSIEESVYQLLVDIIIEFGLDFDVKKSQITHRKTGSTIRFKGCREQGAVSLKSMEGVDILWVEEAQSITKATLDILIPTIRKDDAIIIFTMNRYLRSDPVYAFCSNRSDCHHTHINFDENPFCPESLKKEAEECKVKNIKDYNHIWLGQPLDVAVDYLFNFSKLDKILILEPFGDMIKSQTVMAVDYASGGGDLCVASKLERRSNVHWELTEQKVWDDPDTDLSVGKTIAIYGDWNPEILIVDSGGLGYPMFVSLSKTIKNIIGFDGASTDKVSENTGNNRAEAYVNTKEYTDQEWLICKSQYTKNDFETIKRKYTANGKIYIQSKVDAKKEGISSQDRGDSVAMAIFCIKHYLGKVNFEEQDTPIGMRVKRKSGRKKI